MIKVTTIAPTEDAVVFVRGGVAYLYLKKGLTGVVVYDDDNAISLDLTDDYQWI